MRLFVSECAWLDGRSEGEERDNGRKSLLMLKFVRGGSRSFGVV